MKIPSGFKNLGHFIASTAQKFVTVTKNLEKFAQAEKPVVDAVAAVIGPIGVAIDNGAYALLGLVGQLEDSGQKVVTDITSKAGSPELAADILAAIALAKQVPKAV